MLMYEKEPLCEAEIDFLIELVQDNINEGDLCNELIVLKLKFIKEKIKNEAFTKTLTTADEPSTIINCRATFAGELPKKPRRK